MRSLVLFVVAVLSFNVLAEGGLFEDLSFEKALQKAKSGEKLVFVDFYTTWCGPCKRLDKTTWKDDKVKAWLKERTIPLKINAEVQTDLAKKYRIQAYPTLLFIHPDGEIAHRVTGYRDADEFLKSCEDAVSNRDFLAEYEESYRKALESDQLDAQTFMKYTDALIERGKYKEALKEYVSVLDSSEKDIARVSMSFLTIRKIVSLSRLYEPARMELLNRRNALLENFEKGDVSQTDLQRLFSFNRNLKETEKNLEIYDRMKEMDIDDRMMNYTFNMVYGQLLNHRRYDEILEKVKVEDKIEEAYKSRERMNDLKELGDEGVVMANGLLVNSLSSVYQLLLGTDQGEKASDLANKILEVDKGANTYNSLAWSGFRSGKANKATLEYARKAFELSEEKSAAIIDTYARVLDVLGQTGEAIKLVEKSAPDFVGREAKTLEKTLEDIKSGNNGKLNI